MSRVWYNDTARRRLRSVHIAPARKQKLKLKTIDQNGVRDFHEIEDWQQSANRFDRTHWQQQCILAPKTVQEERRGTAADLGERILVAGQPTDSQ
jgi:hypothetical protein